MGTDPTTSRDSQEQRGSLDDEWWTVSDIGHLVKKSDRTVHRNIKKHALRTKVVFTPKGKVTYVHKESAYRLAELLACQIAQAFPRRRREDILPENDDSGGVEQGDDHSSSRTSFGLSDPRGSAYPPMTRDELRDLLAEAIAKGMAQAAREGTSFLNEPSGAGRWTLFTGAALVTAMAVVAVAIMQHTLAIA